jgi:nuclear protein localization family protein 4
MYIITFCWLQVHDIFGLTGYAFALYRKHGYKDELISSRSKTVCSYGLSHGDMLYLAPLNGAMLWSQDSSPIPSTSSGESQTNSTPTGELVDSTELALGQTQSSLRQSIALQEDEVDLQLQKLDGKVQRKQDEKL